MTTEVRTSMYDFNVGCPKCRSTQSARFYCKGCKEAPKVEHLHVICTGCQYPRTERYADAKQRGRSKARKGESA
jgi:hypothetical protein